MLLLWWWVVFGRHYRFFNVFLVNGGIKFRLVSVILLFSISLSVSFDLWLLLQFCNVVVICRVDCNIKVRHLIN